ncbi:HAD family hydrolase [Nocardioides sp. GXQ0305]|uniref:HAD family hydrolase n=1 Tax=Nocardioides sp. GXQ0305 TaxID=3423912 RepID=UPI003D7CFCF1
MRAPRLVATDLDGTLLRTDGSLSDRSRDVLAELDGRGVPVVIVTGRPMRWLSALRPVVGRHGLAIVSNGAAVYDVAADEAHDVRGIEVAVGAELARRIEEHLPGATFAVETVAGISIAPGFLETERIPEGSSVASVGELWSAPALKLLVRHPDADHERLRERVEHAVGDLATPTWSMEGLVEISATGVTKASALAALAERLGVDDSDTVAFGDMPNDVPMLRWAGTSYAVANAHPDVLDAADRQAPANDEDGVAAVLADLFGL